jgi:arylsulfatase B
MLLPIAALLTACAAEREPADASANAPDQPPNIILVITDDQGYGDLGAHGHPFLKTPALDRLHAESTRLTDFHVSPTCAPTRAALMSGQWTNRTGAWHTVAARSMMFADKATLGTVLSENGYATGLFGKWHLGDNYPFRPEDRGFQEVVRHGGGGIGQTPDYWNNAYFDDTYFHNGEPRQFEGYCTDVFFAEAKRFIKEQSDTGKPFFAYISTNAPHSPFHVADSYWKPYLDYEGVNPMRAIFYGMIANIDENVGALRQWLASEGLAENTIFIFMTDNGSSVGAPVYNAGMRGNKGKEYEGGHRVPFFLHWPARGWDQPRDIDTLTAHIDILPTLMELGQLESAQDLAPDGRSLLPLLEDPQADWPERVMITDSQRVVDPIKWKQSSTMTERWRLINGEELYDIVADPGETTDLAEAHPEVVAELRAAYDAWWADLQPAFSRQARIHLGNPAENPTVLTCHDWLTGGAIPPWHQGWVRETRDVGGPWAVTVEAAGDYRIALRRWPSESGLSLRSPAEPGDPVPGLEAYRETEGLALPIASARIEYADERIEMAIPEDRPEAVFEVELPAGDLELKATFTLDSGEEITAYYAYVEKL